MSVEPHQSKNATQIENILSDDKCIQKMQDLLAVRETLEFDEINKLAKNSNRYVWGDIIFEPVDTRDGWKKQLIRACTGFQYDQLEQFMTIDTDKNVWVFKTQYKIKDGSPMDITLGFEYTMGDLIAHVERSQNWTTLLEAELKNHHHDKKTPVWRYLVENSVSTIKLVPK